MKAKIFILIVIVISLLLVVFEFINKNKETSTPLSNKKLSNQYITGGNISFSIEKSNFKLPKELPVYKTNTTNESDYGDLALKLGFINKPQIFKNEKYGDTIIYSVGSQNLTIYGYPEAVDYKISLKNENFTKDYSQEEQVAAVYKFLNENKFPVDIDSLKLMRLNKINIGSGGHYYEGSEYNSTELHFTQLIDNYDILSKTGFLLKATLNSENKITRIFFDKNISLEHSPVSNLETIDYDKMLSQIDVANIVEINDGKVIYNNSPISVKSLEINKYIISYYIEEINGSNFLYPVILLYGKAISQNNSSLNLVFMIPAIDVTKI